MPLVALTPAALEAFRARFACASAGRGGVAFNLDSGAYFALNQTAAFICARLLDTSLDQLTVRVAAQFSLTPEAATAAITELLTDLATPGTPGVAVPPTDDFPYRRVDQRYVLFHREEPLLSVDALGSEARLCPGATASGFSPAYLLRLASPKILQANGVGVVHAAACTTAAGLLVVSGRSGAGKSTTAGLLSHYLAAPAFADDLVVLGESGEAGHARPGAEAKIYAWCDEAGPRLPDGPLPLQGLVAAATAPPATAPIGEILLVARERRGGSGFRSERLTPEAALLEILNAVFLGAAEAGAIRRYLDICRQLALAVRMSRAYVPAGLPGLRTAVQAYAAASARS